MAYLLEKKNGTAWDDISQQSERFILDEKLDMLADFMIEYNGQSLKLDDDSLTLVHDDYIRYGTDGADENNENILRDLDSMMDWVAGYNWIADPGLPPDAWDIATTVAGKMYYDAKSGAADALLLDLPNTLAYGHVYRIKVKVRLNASGGDNKIRFGFGIGVAATAYLEVTATGSETEYEGTITSPSTAHNDLYIYTLAGTSGAFEIDDLEVYLESPPVLFSGYVRNLLHYHKLGKYEFDLYNDVDELKNEDIPRVLTGNTLLDRINSGMPSGWAVHIMNSTAMAMLLYDTPTDIPNLDTITYPGDEVTGTDSNIYTCKLSHESAASNKPITGGSWATYWELAGSTGGTWATAKLYYAMKFKDLLFDTLLLANRSQSNYLLFCVVVNFELRFYAGGYGGTQSWIALTKANTKINAEALSYEYVFIPMYDNITDELRGDPGTLNFNNAANAEFNMYVHKAEAITEKFLMDPTSVPKPISGYVQGFITSKEKRGSMYKYELTYLDRL